MGWRTVRRKLQKKVKRKTYDRCPSCGRRRKAAVYQWGIRASTDEPIYRIGKRCEGYCTTGGPVF